MLSKGEKKLNKKDLFGIWARWVCFANGMVNYERMQGIGFCHAMTPAINKLYDTKEERVAALKRHSIFFNTNTAAGSIIVGLVAAMEEQRANGMDIGDDTINSVKVSLMGPVAGLGDSIFQATLFPILLSIGIALALQGNILGPILYTILVLGIVYPLDWWWYNKAYKEGSPLLARLMETGLLDKVTQGASMVGLLAAGTLTARYINFQIKYEIPLAIGEPLNIQTEILDKIVPNLLPLLLVLGCWRALRKQSNIRRLVIVIFIIGIVLGSLGII